MSRPATGRGVTAIVLAALCALQLLALLRAPAAWMPDRIAVTLARGQALTLGRDALAAPQADEAQLRLRRDMQGHWWFANASPAAPLPFVERGAAAPVARTGSIALAPALAFQLGATTFTVTAADAGGVTLAAGGVRWRYDGAALARGDGPAGAQDACPDARVGARLAAAWNRSAPRALTLARPLVFGGNLDCGNRIAIAGLAAPAATIARTPDGFVLAAGPAPLQLQGGGLLADREERVDGKAALVAGRTRLGVAIDGDVLILRPVSHVALYALPQQRLPEGVAWTWTRRANWALPPPAFPAAVTAGLATIVLAALATLAAGRRRARTMPAWHAVGATLLAAAGAGLLILQRLGAPAGPGVALAVAWAALWFLLLAVTGRRTALAPCAGVLLLAVGLLAQLDLGLGTPESSWLRHFHKSAAVLALGVGLTLPACALARRLRPAQGRVEAGLLGLAGLALLALLLQVAFGDETGVFDLQPVEFAKLALAALTAHCLALDSGDHPAIRKTARRWLLTLAPSLLFVALLAVALVQVDDYSPLVLLLVWSGTLALAHALATRRRLLAGVLAAGALAAVLGVAALHGANAAQLARWNFYADRFLVWLDPGAHPHTGQQLLLGARAIHDGGWWGADGAGGVLALGGDAGAALRVPAVQDDFAASFFLARHGLAAGLALWMLQVAFVGGLLHLALGCWRDGLLARDFRTAWLARLRCFLLAGGAAFTFGHFLLSWGTNLGILPIMGQPMSFLSAGGSHLLFFICPLLGLAIATSESTSQPMRENDDAGLRPT